MSLREVRHLMARLNPDSQVVPDKDGTLVITEDVFVEEGQPSYELRYLCSPDARKAVGHCLFSPGGLRFSYTTHLAVDGFLDLGGSTRVLTDSPLSLAAVVRRARWWCFAYSHFLRTGVFPTPYFGQESTHVIV